MTARAGVLVTRPAGQGNDLCAALGRAGFSAHSLPLLQLLPLPELAPAQRQLVLDLDQFSHIIFVSGNAVRWGMAWIESCWPQLPVGLNWYAVGDASARLLSAYGVKVATPGAEMSTEGLLALPQLQAAERPTRADREGRGRAGDPRRQSAPPRRAGGGAGLLPPGTRPTWLAVSWRGGCRNGISAWC